MMKKILLSLVAMAAGTWAMAQTPTPVSIYDISYVSPSELAACVDTNIYLNTVVKHEGT